MTKVMTNIPCTHVAKKLIHGDQCPIIIDLWRLYLFYIKKAKINQYQINIKKAKSPKVGANSQKQLSQWTVNVTEEVHC